MNKIIIGHTTLFGWFMVIFLLLHVTTIVSTKTIEDKKVVDIGVIFDFDSRMWKEVHTAIEIACRKYNDSSMGNYELKPHYKDSQGSSLQAISAARKLIEEKVKVIIGLDEWQEAVLVAEFCNDYQIPVLSLAKSPLAPGPTVAAPWPLLIRMSNSILEQIRCIVDIIYAYNKGRVSIIYEEEPHGDLNSNFLCHLYEELGVIGSEVVEHVQLLPAFSSSSISETLLKQSLMKIKAQPPSVIIVLRLSLPIISTLLKEAKKIGLFGEGYEWIFAESPSSFLDLVDSDLTFSMKDVTIMRYYPRNNFYLDFLHRFDHEFYLNRKEVSYYPGIHASCAYDMISTISNAIEKVPSDHFTSGLLFRSIVQNKFIGLSGEIYYEAGQLLYSTELEIISFRGKNETKELICFWSPKTGFSRNPPRRIPSAAEAQKELKPMVIGVPRKTFFDKFAKERRDGTFEGFCIDVFTESVSRLGLKLRYEFGAHDGSYDDLIQKVNNGTYGAAVGDVTILANRAGLVEFTQPYKESRLSMIVLTQPDPEKGWIFIKPFTPLMWAAFGGVLIYTMFIVWVLEHRSNPEFNGPWTHQISTAAWFTFSSLFFALRERTDCYFTRIVLVVWFFVALILTQSYTASLTSLLTVQRLRSNVTTMEWLRATNARVGCHNNSFVCNYLENVYEFKREAIVGIGSITDHDYGKEFQSGNITALFLEHPYVKAFFTKYCTGYVVTQFYNFGGFGFAFPKNSPLVDNFSQAILQLTEEGVIEGLENKWFSSECSTAASDETLRLSFDGFWVLLASTLVVSTLSILLSLVCFKKSHQCHKKEQTDSFERELNVYSVAI